MRERIQTAMKEAMKAGNKRRLSTLRLVTAAIKDRDIAARVDDKGQSTGKERVEDSDILALLQKMIKQRRESVEIYTQGGREELAEQEAAEIAIIEEFLPQQMGEDAIRQAAQGIVAELGASGLKDMGRVMSALKERYTGQMDFSKASAMVKEALK
ncbi:MAG TPA: GatB/YqeY domain-containing protein [Hyphomicrobiaceae bacterium]|nr:GatB/YqeY domain-containing protein [Hyphomicrobiaceae bacterium]